MFIEKLVIGNPNACVYKFIIDMPNQNPVVIIQLFIVDVLGIFLEFNINIPHIFYGCTFSYCNYVTLIFVKDKYYLCTNDFTTVFEWSSSYKH